MLAIDLDQGAVQALHAAARLTEQSNTETINSALHKYWALVEAAAEALRRGVPVTWVVEELLGDGEDSYEITVRKLG
jgi:hypothetical protein